MTTKVHLILAGALTLPLAAATPTLAKDWRAELQRIAAESTVDADNTGRNAQDAVGKTLTPSTKATATPTAPSRNRFASRSSTGTSCRPTPRT